MAGSMKAVTETGIELSNEERNLLSVAYKVNSLLNCLRTLKNIIFSLCRMLSEPDAAPGELFPALSRKPRVPRENNKWQRNTEKRLRKS